MNIETAEKISNSPGEFPGDQRHAAWTWADKKRLDKSLSEDFRQRASDVFFKIFNWATSQKTDNKYKAF